MSLLHTSLNQEYILDSIRFQFSLVLFTHGSDEEFQQFFNTARQYQSSTPNNSYSDYSYFVNSMLVFEYGFENEFKQLFGFSRNNKAIPYLTTYGKKLEDALFGGYDGIHKYYQGTIYNKCKSFYSERRTTLNFQDLQQICSIKLLECWNNQQEKTFIKCFDAFFKQSVTNCLKTQYTKAHCGRRGGSQDTPFLSEIEENGEYFPDENSVQDKTRKFIDNCKSILGNYLGNLFELIVCSGDFKFTKSTFVEVATKNSIPFEKVKEGADKIVFILRGYKEELLGHSNYLSV